MDVIHMFYCLFFIAPSFMILMTQAYQIGVGIADITGPAAEINMMGYAKMGQDTAGIHTRLYSRAFIVADQEGNRVCYVNTDLGMISQAIKIEVTARLAIYNGLYTQNNVMLTATHTHSGPAGYLQYVLYIISSQGFIWQNFDAIVSGIVKSIEKAHHTMRDGKVFYNQGDLLDASINRSPYAYIANPSNEIKKYNFDTDKIMQILKFVDSGEKPIGVISWFAVHPTSMNNTNQLISSDNKGYAELLFERKMNGNKPLGRGPFVAAFANSNQGDVSPNTKGPRCIDSGAPCDMETSTCTSDDSGKIDGFSRRINQWRKFSLHIPFNRNEPASRRQDEPLEARERESEGTEERRESSSPDKVYAREKRHPEFESPYNSSKIKGNSKCIASGPGSDMFESTKIIGEKQYQKARELFETANTEVDGRVIFLHQHVDMSNVLVLLSDNRTVRTCKPAMGYSFAAGTIDGAGAFDFHQGETKSTPFWNFVRDFIKRPSEDLIMCHYPKPILLATGEMKFPYPWQPSIMPTQIFKVGSIVIVGLPAEFTTMAGRRVREAVKEEFAKENIEVQVIIAGLANAYSSYVTTFEEYQKQRYEAASTIYGPHTLQAYIQQYRMLAYHIATGRTNQVTPGPEPPNLLNRQISFKPGVVMDSSFNRRFGEVLRDAHPKYVRGETVSVTFVSGNPRNNLQTDKTFLTVERFSPNIKLWKVVATDANWETKFYWYRKNRILGESEAVVTWEIPLDAEPGKYRIQHFGFSKNLFQVQSPYVGTSSVFKVEP